MTQELVTFTIRYRATKEEAQTLMEDERARVLHGTTCLPGETPQRPTGKPSWRR